MISNGKYSNEIYRNSIIIKTMFKDYSIEQTLINRYAYSAYFKAFYGMSAKNIKQKYGYPIKSSLLIHLDDTHLLFFKMYLQELSEYHISLDGQKSALDFLSGCSEYIGRKYKVIYESIFEGSPIHDFKSNRTLKKNKEELNPIKALSYEEYLEMLPGHTPNLLDYLEDSENKKKYEEFIIIYNTILINLKSQINTSIHLSEKETQSLIEMLEMNKRREQRRRF